MKEILAAHGFVFDSACNCGGFNTNYKNKDKPTYKIRTGGAIFEVQERKNVQYVIIGGGRQENLEQTLINLGL